MPGFGSGTFGSGPFGRFDWSRQVLWNDLPEIDRSLDAGEGNRLEKFSEAAQPLFEELLLKAAGFGDLRDADMVRTQFQGRLTVTPLSSVGSSNGTTVEVILKDPDTGNPLVPLGEASVGWIFRDANGSEWTVNSVHKLDSRGPVLELVGSTVPDTEAELGVGNADAVIRPPGLIQYLGADYGISIDTHEPEAFQRSSVRNVSQWLTLKGTEKSYDILGKISGYRATPLGLWRLGSPIPFGIPSDRVFEVPLGSGAFYTDLAPVRPIFDEISADVIPLDYFCFEEISGVSVGDTIGATMQGLVVSQKTDLGSNRWRVKVTGDLSPIGAIGHWVVSIPALTTDSYYVETVPVEVTAGEWEFEFYATNTVMASVVVSSTVVNLDYECPVAAKCDYCRSSVIRVEVVPTEVLTDPDALIDGVLTRLARKILQVVPVHVRVTDTVHIVGPVQATLGIQILVSTMTAISVPAPVGYYYDIVPADELEVDPSHMAVSATTFTVP